MRFNVTYGDRIRHHDGTCGTIIDITRTDDQIQFLVQYDAGFTASFSEHETYLLAKIEHDRVLPRNEVMVFPDKLGGKRALCRIRLVAHEGRVVCICTEVPDNPGMSVTNQAEHIATIVRQRYCPQQELLWIEQYPYHRLEGLSVSGTQHDGTVLKVDDHFSFVTFTWDAHHQRYRNPEWRFCAGEDVIALVGEAFFDHVHEAE